MLLFAVSHFSLKSSMSRVSLQSGTCMLKLNCKPLCLSYGHWWVWFMISFGQLPTDMRLLNWNRELLCASNWSWTILAATCLLSSEIDLHLKYPWIDFFVFSWSQLWKVTAIFFPSHKVCFDLTKAKIYDWNRCLCTFRSTLIVYDVLECDCYQHF